MKERGSDWIHVFKLSRYSDKVGSRTQDNLNVIPAELCQRNDEHSSSIIITQVMNQQLGYNKT